MYLTCAIADTRAKFRYLVMEPKTEFSFNIAIIQDRSLAQEQHGTF